MSNPDSGDGGDIVVEVDEDLIPTYIENRRGDIEAIKKAVADGDFSEVTTRGHTMKGSGAGYGFDFVSEAGTGIEAAGKVGDGTIALQWTARLENYLGRVVVVPEE